MKANPDSEKAKTYRLSWVARATRWWRMTIEVLSFLLLGLLTVGGLIALLSGHPAAAGAFGVVGLFYVLYAYTNWFWWWN